MSTTPTENTYNPFPGVTDVAPVWVHSGICFSRAVFRDREVAEKVAAAVRATGGTVNGGFMHGQPLGSLSQTMFRDEIGWEVTY